VLVTALPQLAEGIGVNRIVRGRAVPHPFGSPDLSPEDEVAFRRSLVELALHALAQDVEGPRVFE
jgi:betaine reductase